MNELPDAVFEAAHDRAVAASYEPEADRATIGMSPHAFRAALALAYAAGRDAAHAGGRTQWGIRRVGYRSVRITSDTNARSLLRGWVVPGEMVSREVGPWEVVATNADILAQREGGK